MNAPIPFIRLENKGSGKHSARTYSLNEEACELLRAIKGPVGIVTVAGLYRTGKSYILNKLAGRSAGFDIGSTVEPCTQGIWMWIVDAKASPHVPKDFTVVLLDTEGLGSYTKNKTYDIQIFSLSVLLASLFIYNSMGSIDETALDRLSLVVELTKHIKAQAADEKSTAADLNAFFPKFIWLVRDFSLKLVSNGRDISSKEYLENSLAPLQGTDARLQDKNAIRQSITQFFVDRTCITMRRPVNDEKMLQHMDSVTDDELRPQFVEELQAFIKTTYTSVRPKRLFSEALTGPMFVELARNYVQAINDGSVPVIRSAWENVIEVENQKVISAAQRIYEETLGRALADGVLDAAEFDAAHERALADANTHFSTLVKGDRRTAYEARLRKQIDAHRDQQRRLNATKSEKLCTVLMEQIAATVSAKVDSGAFKRMEDLSDFWRGQLTSTYDAQARGPAKDAVLARSLRQQTLETARRLMAHVTKTLAQQHEAELKAQRERMEVEVKRVEGMYDSVADSWSRTKRQLQELEEENQSLINTIARLSEVM